MSGKLKKNSAFQHFTAKNVKMLGKVSRPEQGWSKVPSNRPMACKNCPWPVDFKTHSCLLQLFFFKD